jgi:hypothetical protein
MDGAPVEGKNERCGKPTLRWKKAKDGAPNSLAGKGWATRPSSGQFEEYQFRRIPLMTMELS